MLYLKHCICQLQSTENQCSIITRNKITKEHLIHHNLQLRRRDSLDSSYILEDSSSSLGNSLNCLPLSTMSKIQFSNGSSASSSSRYSTVSAKLMALTFSAVKAAQEMQMAICQSVSQSVCLSVCTSF